MKPRNWLVVVALVAGLLAGSARMTGARSPGACEVDFEAAVRLGPNQGLTMVGELQFHWDSRGSLTGKLIREDGSVVPVAGQVEGRAINLIFTVGPNTHIYGTGTLENDVSTCSGAIGGPFAGPARADMGTWDGSVRAFSGADPYSGLD